MLFYATFMINLDDYIHKRIFFYIYYKLLFCIYIFMITTLKYYFNLTGFG